jgi:hypothetical protein
MLAFLDDFSSLSSIIYPAPCVYLMCLFSCSELPIIELFFLLLREFYITPTFLLELTLFLLKITGLLQF